MNVRAITIIALLAALGFCTGIAEANSFPTYSATPLGVDLDFNSHTIFGIGDLITKRPWVDVRAFGAVANDGANDQPAIQAAINSLPASGGTVFLPAGTYNTASTITLIPNLCLRGEGQLGSGTTILPQFNGNALSLSYGSDTYGGITIENLSIIGDYANYPTGHGIYLNHVFNVTIRDVTSGLMGDDGFHVQYGWHIYFRDTYAGNNSDNGYYINTPHCHLLRSITDGGVYSVVVDTAGEQVTIEGCHFEGATTGGILLNGSHSHKIVGNYITGPPIGILDGDYTNRVEIIGNSIWCCAETGNRVGIKLTGGASYLWTIAGNYIGRTDTGIECHNAGWDTISGNTIEATNGLVVNPQDVSYAVTVSGNSINSTSAITHTAGNKTMYTGNVLVGTFTRTAGTPSIFNQGNAGFVTLATAVTTTVNNANVTGNSKIFLFPTSSAAGTMVQGSKSPYIYAQSAGTSFTIRTADGSNAPANASFNYLIVD